MYYILSKVFPYLISSQIFLISLPPQIHTFLCSLIRKKKIRQLKANKEIGIGQNKQTEEKKLKKG